MYLWKVRCTTARQWKARKDRPNREVINFLLLCGKFNDKRFMKPIYVEYYVTVDMGEDTLREAVKATGRDPVTIKKFKMLGDVRNGVGSYVTSRHFHACLEAKDKRIMEDDATIRNLRTVNEELTAQLTAKKSRHTRPLG